MLINLLEITGREYIHHLSTLRPLDNAVFAVAWAGHETSQNWFHIAREYTEKFLHQQQIRDAVGKQGIMTEELYRPFLDTLMFAFPYTFRNTSAKEGTVVSVKITTDIGGTWSIVKTADRWLLLDKNQPMPTDAQVILDPDTAWKLFSKSLQPEQVMDKVELDGNEILAQQVLKIVAVMA